MSRLLVPIIALVLLAGCAQGIAPERSHAAILVGVGDQWHGTFTEPLFTKLKLKRSRVFVPWNAVLSRTKRESVDLWIDSATAVGVEPFVTFGVTDDSKCPRRPCKLPSVRQYTKAFKAFRKRYPEVKIFGVWNEANHRSQPTFKNPKRAAQFFNVVRARCRGCKIVAADVIDERNMESWLKVFKRHARGERLWGLHNYRDTNPRKNQRLGGTARLLKTVRGEVWLTETGGIVTFTLPDRRTLFRTDERRANSAVKRMFRLAHRYRKRIKRLYIYHWRQSSGRNRFDAGLLDKSGKARPGYYTVKRYLATRSFNP